MASIVVEPSKKYIVPPLAVRYTSIVSAVSESPGVIVILMPLVPAAWVPAVKVGLGREGEDWAPVTELRYLYVYT